MYNLVQASKKRLLSLTNTVMVSVNRSNFHSTFMFDCFLSHRTLLYSLFFTELSGAHFGIVQQKGGFLAWDGIKNKVV